MYGFNMKYIAIFMHICAKYQVDIFVFKSSFDNNNEGHS